MIPLTEKLQKKLVAIPDLVAAYVLGSAVSGRMRRESDLDVALLFAPGKIPDPMALLGLAADLEQEVGRTVDIGILSTDRNLDYAYEAIMKGRCVFSRDDGHRDLFAATALNGYLQLRLERREIEAGYAA